WRTPLQPLAGSLYRYRSLAQHGLAIALWPVSRAISEPDTAASRGVMSANRRTTGPTLPSHPAGGSVHTQAASVAGNGARSVAAGATVPLQPASGSVNTSALFSPTSVEPDPFAPTITVRPSTVSHPAFTGVDPRASVAAGCSAPFQPPAGSVKISCVS